MKLYDNAFSPFARKVRIVLDVKGLDYETVDGLNKANTAALEAVNGRVEVPTLVDGDVTVVNSADIVAYLEHAYPEPSVYPGEPAARVRARAWERCADTVVDPILVDISYWMWADRPDDMPAGLKEAAHADLDQVYDALERDLDGREFLCGAMSIADIALFPHLAAVQLLGVSFSRQRHPRLAAWFKRLRGVAECRADHERTRLPRRSGRPQHRAPQDLLARRPHRMDPRARLSGLVHEGNRRRAGHLARTRCARTAELTSPFDKLRVRPDLWKILTLTLSQSKCEGERAERNVP